MASWKLDNGAFYKALMTFCCSEYLGITFGISGQMPLCSLNLRRMYSTLVKTDLIFKNKDFSK